MLGKRWDYHFFPNDWTDSVIVAFADIKSAILDGPILARVDPNKRIYLKTDFTLVGLGAVACQPDDNEESIVAMQREDAGGHCEFDRAIRSPLRLRPLSFVSRATRGHESHYHSAYGEVIGAAWAIQNHKHYCYGRPFTLICDCKAFLWLLSYDNDNHALRRLQMFFWGYWFTIAHRPKRLTVDCDYFSRLGTEISIDPLLHQYEFYSCEYYPNHTPPNSELIQPAQLLDRSRAKVEHYPSLSESASRCEVDDRTFLHVPVQFSDRCAAGEIQTCRRIEMTRAALSLYRFTWFLCNFGSGHFMSTCMQRQIPFTVHAAPDTSLVGRSLFQGYGGVDHIVRTIPDLKVFCDSVFAKGDQAHGLYVTLPYSYDTALQESVVRSALALLDSLVLRHLYVAVFEFPNGTMSGVTDLVSNYCKRDKYRCQRVILDYPDFGGCVEGSAIIMICTITSVCPGEHAPEWDIQYPPNAASTLGFCQVIHEESLIRKSMLFTHYLVAATPKYDNEAPDVEAYVGYTFCFNNRIIQSIPSTPDMVARVCDAAFVAHVNVLMLNSKSYFGVCIRFRLIQLLYITDCG